MKRLSLMAFTLIAFPCALAAATAASAADLSAPVYKAPQPPPLLYPAPYKANLVRAGLNYRF